ncbi:hypothetical protein DS745_22700 [Anaerobacillus alkaliphilus]|uniref:Uncharacterized protein n=1 Tax=Anaerobacillus alkaliphilus TaxID=1548597 RepID=A0A4Q0VME0_9BACI|nr:hypothetical protein [Anaerobacillus alkaliphilus]RXI96521.1 hypothetical protein DS745_22700 [Anaerobacillus alkaliphilus]
MNNDYQTLINGIFVCGLPALPFVLEKEDIQVIVDLRAEADKSETKDILIPLVDGQPNQEHLLREAIGHVVRAYEQGKKVVLH